LINSSEQKISLPDLAEGARASSDEVTVIKSSDALFGVDFASLWAYRELFYFLAMRDIKVRYKQTALGVAWVLLQPAATTVVFTIIFNRLGYAEAAGAPYALFAFSGFVLWTFVNAAITNASNSLTNHTGLITKVYFPRLIVPASAVAASLLDLAVGLLSLTAALVFYGVALSWKLFLAPLFVVLILLLVVGIGVLLAALNVKFRDVKQLLPFALQLWLFLSPVFYSLALLPENLRWLWRINPLSGALEGFRAAIFNQEFDLPGIALSVFVTFVVLLLALFVFRQMEDDFADVI
jgi:lipopolysaccharide transport system permease protein